MLANITNKRVCIPPFAQQITSRFDLTDVNAFASLSICKSLDNTKQLNGRDIYFGAHPLLANIPSGRFNSIVVSLLKKPLPDLRQRVKPYCSVGSAIHVRSMEGACNTLMKSESNRNFCNITPKFVKYVLHECPLTTQVYMASDRQQLQTEERLRQEFKVVQYFGKDAVLVDLMVLTIAASRGCALLNPASTFTQNALILIPNVMSWCDTSS